MIFIVQTDFKETGDFPGFHLEKPGQSRGHMTPRRSPRSHDSSDPRWSDDGSDASRSHFSPQDIDQTLQPEETEKRVRTSRSSLDVQPLSPLSVSHSHVPLSIQTKLKELSVIIRPFVPRPSPTSEQIFLSGCSGSGEALQQQLPPH